MRLRNTPEHVWVFSGICAAMIACSPVKESEISGSILSSHVIPIDRCGPGQRDDAVVASAAGIDVEALKQVRDIRALSNDDICTVPKSVLARAIFRTHTPKPDSPGEWAEFRAMEQQGDDGTVDPNGLIRGLQSRQNLLRLLRTGQIRPMDAGISSKVWKPLGPGNIGGRIRAVAISPNDPKKIWIGSVSGGIWASADAGQSWKSINDFMASVAVSTIIIDPVNPKVMYAGTGEGFFHRGFVRGLGVFKSLDEGKTWQPLAATDPKTDKGWYYVNRLAMHPKNTKIILAATRGGVFRSSDGGKKWTKVSKYRTLDLDFDPNDPNTVIAGTIQGHTLLSRDSGVTWKLMKIWSVKDRGRVEVAFAPSAKGVVYASVDEKLGTILRSTDGGATWQQLSIPKHLSRQGWYANAIWVDPVNEKHLIVGGLDLYRSVDGGLTFSKISKWHLAPQSAHADHHIIVAPSTYVPGTNPVVYFANDGGLYRAANVETVKESAGWEILNNGLAITQFYSVAASADGKNIVGGTQDNGSLVRIGTSMNWATYFGGDGSFSQIDQTDKKVFYGGLQYLGLFRSLQSGSKATRICKGIKEAYKKSCGGTQKTNFISPFILDPNNQDRLLAGADSLWLTDNAKKAPTPDWRVVKKPAPGKRNYIKSIAVAQGKGDIIWVGHNRGNVYYTTVVSTDRRNTLS